MTELEKLKAYLDEHEYNNHYRQLFENENDQIVVFDGAGRSWDAICHKYSYGGDRGLLEIYGSICPTNDPIGYLTAQQVIDRLERRGQEG